MSANQNTPLARGLRSRQTDAEAKLWWHLRNRTPSGFKFRRQAPMGPYIVDFVCLERSLIVEADGSQHADSKSDKERDRYFTGRGYRVLRFWNREILHETESVLESIHNALMDSPHGR